MSFNSSQKGISPIIAAIILIAFVVSVAGIVGPWLTEFIQERTGEATNTGSEEVECAYAGIHLRDVTENSTGGNLTLTAEVENTGDVELINFVVELTHKDATITHLRPDEYNQTLKKGSRRTFTVEVNTTRKGDVDKLALYSEVCPEETRGEMNSVYFS